MSKRNLFTIILLIIILCCSWILFSSKAKKDDFSEHLKVTLRDVGHQLLSANKDHTSLVLPVIAIDDHKYQISFQKPLTIEPDNLVTIVQKSFHKAKVNHNYRIEVKPCKKDQVVYSYEVVKTTANNIIPCRGRVLPSKCYVIEVKLIQKTSLLKTRMLLYLLLFMSFIVAYLLYKKPKNTLEKPVNTVVEKDGAHNKIGHFKFYPEQHKLVKEATEISLSKKECELLAIFIAQPNQIITREELTKRVWEDNGVFVGRSLDTYISKLRKKLKDDDTIKITNIHGVGYKLEV